MPLSSLEYKIQISVSVLCYEVHMVQKVCVFRGDFIFKVLPQIYSLPCNGVNLPLGLKEIFCI